MTRAPAFVEIRLNQFPLFAVVLIFGEMLPLGAKRFGKAVGKMKGDELRQPRFVAVRQITTLMPTTKTLLGIF